MRTMLLIVGFVCLSSCAYTPPGSCTTNADCRAGAHCDTGVCVMGCENDSHCLDWQACNTENRRCVPRPGNCALKADCEAWEVCSENVCKLGPGACLSSADCQSYQTCTTDHICGLQPGRCNTSYECPGLWPLCDATHTCGNASLEGSDVILWGTLSEGACYMDAVAPISQPEKARVGFGCYSGGDSAFVRPDGSIVYVDADGTTDVARVFVPDEFKRVNDWWTYPSDPAKNDPVIPTPGCPTAASLRLLVQQGTGKILHACDASGNWYDSAGTLVVSAPGILAWNASGQFLVMESSTYFLLDAQGNRTDITGLPPEWSMVDARAGGSGFLIALGYWTTVRELALWNVDAQGQATKRSDYAPTPDGFNTPYEQKLDPTGALYAMSWKSNGGFIDVIVKYPPDGSAASVVYSEANAPANANDFRASSLNLYTMIHISSLVRGP